mgnify:CR=1 FL=1
MCGIVGAIADRDVVPMLLEWLKRLVYRGYDSPGISLIDYAVRPVLRRVRCTVRASVFATVPYAGGLYAQPRIRP